MKAAKASGPRPSGGDEPAGAAGGRKRPTATEALVARVRDGLGADWPGRVYRERVHALRTRSHSVPTAAGKAPPEILHTLLGVELKVGRRRVSCPDLATARYLRVFARAGVAEVAVPYDITKISRLADELESGWQRMLLLADSLTEEQGAGARARLRAAVVREFRREAGEAGAGASVPQFNQNTRQRPERIQTGEKNGGR